MTRRHSVAWVRGTGFRERNLNFEISSEGFESRGWEVRRFERVGEAILRPGDVVHGTVGDIRRILPDLPGVDYPEELRGFLGRDVRKGRFSDIKEEVGDREVFVKPRGMKKRFTGRVVSGVSDLSDLNNLDDEFPVWVSEPLEFKSEWRVYVSRGDVVEVSRYWGDALSFPDPQVIGDMTERLENPSSAAVDVAVDTSGRTVLVEVNDAFSLGNYGLRPMAYAKMIEVAWEDAWASGFVDNHFVNG